MSSTPSSFAGPPEDRLAELLADDAVFGLTAEEQTELDAFRGETGVEQEADAFDRAAAAFYLASAPVETESMPQRLRAAVLDQALPSEPVALAGVDQSPPNIGSIIWPLAVAASLLLGVYLGGRSWGEATLGEQRMALLSKPAVTQVAWTSTNPDAAITGDVVWSDAAQRGFMTFQGLPSNDPTVEQYQLWVFDAERDNAHPVDGGVFDIPSEEGEVVVPIDAKIRVNQAVMFAITVERPGGVVVSDRSRLPLLAKVE